MRRAAPGSPLSPDEHPDFFRVLGSVSEKAGHPAPEDVYAIPELNTFVASRGGRSFMAVGLPMLQSLTVPQWEMVLAHEFGHYAGPFSRLAARFLHMLGVRRTVSPSREFAADRLAAGLGSARELAAALCAVERASLAFGPYWNQEVLPLLEKGWLPPFLEGFRLFKAAPKVREKVADALLESLKNPQQPRRDSHPPLIARLKALGEAARLNDPEPELPAIGLLHDPEAIGQQLLRDSVTEDWQERLRPLSWNMAGEMAFVPYWRSETLKLKGKVPPRLAGLLILDDAALREAGYARVSGLEEGDPRLLHAGAIVYETELLLRLLEEGWDLGFEPGREIELSHEGHHIRPFGLLMGARENALKRLETAKMLEASGVAKLTLGG